MISFSPAAAKRILFITDFYEEEALLGVVDHARVEGWELIANMRFHGHFPSETQADGILVTANGPRVQQWLENWQGTPIVHIGTAPPELAVAWVDVDHAAAGRMGARHLMALGQVHHAFYSLVNRPETVCVRSAFEAELIKSGLQPLRVEIPAKDVGDIFQLPREERLKRLAAELQALPLPLAVMTCDDRRSLELVVACELAGLRIPEDVSILGCENRRVEVNMSSVPLSSVDLNRRLVGSHAAQLLGRLMSGASASPSTLKVPPLGVVGRASTATFATGHAGINRCLDHLRGNYSRPLRLAELSRLAGMSERCFRDEFKRHVGHGPREEIQRARMACATRLLRDTDFKLEAIAVESGFGSAKKLCEFFARIHGVTPQRWRLLARRGRLTEVSRD